MDKEGRCQTPPCYSSSSAYFDLTWLGSGSQKTGQSMAIFIDEVAFKSHQFARIKAIYDQSTTKILKHDQGPN
jgi:hypothetical protein